MDKYVLLLLLIGTSAFGMVWMPSITKRTGVSYSIIYIVFGVLLYTFFPGMLPDPDPRNNEEATLRLTEMVVIVSLMGTGIKIDRPFSFKNWSSPLKLIIIAMLICIATAAFLGYHLLRFDLAAAMLLGAVLAPTDPVLASDVQVGPPNEKRKFETKFSLTAEAGLNDGMAFPFTWLAIALAVASAGGNSNLGEWFAYKFLYKILAGIAIGYLSGKAVGYLVFQASKKYDLFKTRDGFLAISLTLIVYAITELIHGYGFVAVFISAITLRHFEKEHDYHDELHSFTDQAERIMIAVLLILFGGSLVSGIFDALTWKMVLFVLIFFFVVRPLAAYASLFSSKIHIKEKLAISFFGIRGFGSLYYLAFAFKESPFNHKNELWSVVAFTILLSVILHGITATPVMKHLKENMPEEKIPE